MCGVCGKEPCECPKMTTVKAMGALGGVTVATVTEVERTVTDHPQTDNRPIVNVFMGPKRPDRNTPMMRAAQAGASVHRLSGADIMDVHDEASRAHRTLAAVMMPMITDVNASQAQRNFLAEALPVLHGCAATARAMANKNDHIDDAGLDVVERAAMLATRAREIS